MGAVSPKTMPKKERSSHSIEEISLRSQNQSAKNKRSHTRYSRSDIDVEIRPRRLLARNFMRARLIDITAHGASLVSNCVLRESNRLLLKFSFDDGSAFVFKAKVVRRIKRSGQPSVYGIEFENRDARFNDKLLKTQLKLNIINHSSKTTGQLVGDD